MIDLNPLLDLNSFERMVSFHIMTKEVDFQRCDKLTRESGNLIQMVCVNDFGAKVSMLNFLSFVCLNFTLTKQSNNITEEVYLAFLLLFAVVGVDF